MSTRVHTTKSQTPSAGTAPAEMVQRKCACGGPAGLTGECTACNSKGLTLQRRAKSKESPGTVPPIVHEVLGSPGQLLDGSTRNLMTSRFGHDFSKVRVHTDARASKSARQVNALAYTVGHHVVFETGQYQPDTAEGRRLLAHELTHVTQQSHGQLSSTIRVVPDSDPSEVEARQHGAMALDGTGTVLSGKTSSTPLQLTRNGTKGVASSFKIGPGDLDNLRKTMEELLGNLDAKTRDTLTRNKTIVIGLVVDEDGTPTMVYTVSGNWTNKKLRDAADKAGLTRWEAIPRTAGRGAVGAPGDAEQLMIEASDENRFKVSGMAVSRTVCVDCKEEIHAYEHGPIPVVEVKTQAQKAPAAVGSVPEGGNEEGGSTRLRIGSVEAEGEGRSRIVTGTKISIPEKEEIEVGVGGVPRRRSMSLKGGERPGDMPPSPRTTIIGVSLSFAAGIGVNLLKDAFRSKVESDLAKLPKPKIDKRSAKGFLSDPNTADSMRLIDILDKDLLPFGRELQAKHQQLLQAAQLQMLAVSVSTLNAEGRMEYLSSIADELDTYEGQISTIEDNLDAILEKNEDALKTAKACEDLIKVLNNAWIEQHWLETGFSLEDHAAAESNLANLAVTIRGAFKDAQALKAKIEKLDQEERAFRTRLRAAFNIEFDIVFKASLEEQKKRNSPAAVKTPLASAPRKQPTNMIPPEILPSPGAVLKSPEVSPLAAIQPWEDRAKSAGDVAGKFERQKNWLVVTEGKLRELDHMGRRGSDEYKALYQRFDGLRSVWPVQLEQSIALLEKENAAGFGQSTNRLKGLQDWLRTEGNTLLGQVLPPG